MSLTALTPVAGSLLTWISRQKLSTKMHRVYTIEKSLKARSFLQFELALICRPRHTDIGVESVRFCYQYHEI
jgi:hypothetical protein